jgi:hypothetical protein
MHQQRRAASGRFNNSSRQLTLLQRRIPLRPPLQLLPSVPVQLQQWRRLANCHPPSAVAAWMDEWPKNV